MTAAELPSWLRYRTGKRPIVIVAPHGGERMRGIRRDDAMNDLYTAELGRELAARLDAYAVINDGLDRNDVDLNRISAIVERAPQMLRVLRDAVARAGADAATAPLVLFVHGWNVSSLACDIGIGLRESGDELYGAHATVSPVTLRSFVEPFRRALAERGLEGFLGHRYPASGRDNATQLFSGRHLGHDDADVDHLARLALEGGVDAVQLELSIPLRWPGEYRERWTAALEAAIAQHLGARRDELSAHATTSGARRWAPQQAAARPAREQAEAPVDAHGQSIQAVLADGSGLFMGVEPAGPDAFAARVCIARPGGELALFVVEAPWRGSRERFAAGRLEWEPGGSVRYGGPAVLYATHDAFVDLEGGLRTARIVDLEVAIPQASCVNSAAVGGGYVRIGEKVVEVSSPRVRRTGGRFAGERGVRARIWLAGDDGDVVAVEDGTRGASSSAGVRRIPGQITFAENDAALGVHAAALGGEIRAVSTVRVPVYRPGPDGTFVKAVFGVAEIEPPHAGPTGRFGRWALFETVRRMQKRE